MAGDKIKIIPLDVGTLEWDQSEQTLRRGIGKRLNQPFIAWYIDGLGKKVLIDTGPSHEERAQRRHKVLNPRVSGIYMDLVATWHSVERIYRRAKFEINRVIPGHDYGVLKKKSFP